MKTRFAVALLAVAMLCASAMAQDNTAESWFKKGQELGRNGSYEEAVKAYDNVLELEPKNAEAWLGKGIVLSLWAGSTHDGGLYEDAIKAFDKAIELDPQQMSGRLVKASALLNLGRYNESLEIFDEAIEATSQNSEKAQIWFEKAHLFAEQGNYNETTEALEKVIELAPHDIDLSINGGILLSAVLGRYDDALKYYERALQIDPDNKLAWINKANALVRLNQTDEATGAYQEALNITNKTLADDPENSDLWAEKGLLLHNVGNSEEAVKAFANATRINPRDEISWKMMGVLLASELHSYDEAAQAFDGALQINPNDAIVWNLKGDALKTLGRQAEADAAYAKAKELGFEVPKQSGTNVSSTSVKMLAITSIIATGKDEFVEITNNRTEAQSFKGWTLSINDGMNQSSSLPDFSLEPDKRINIHFGKGKSNGTDIFLNSAVTLNDTSGNVTLKDEIGKDVASLGYRVEPDGSVTGTMVAKGEFSYPQSGSNDVKMVVRAAGNGPYVTERTEYEPEPARSNNSSVAQENTADSWYKEAMERYINGSYEDAISAYNKAIEIDPQNSTLWRSIAIAFRDYGKFPLAIEAYGRAAELNPRELGIWNIQGFLFSELGRYSEADEAYDKAIQADPEGAGAWGNKAEALDNMGRHDEAVRAYEKSIKISDNITNANPTDSNSWAGRGYVLMKIGKYDDALKAYDKAIETASSGPSFMTETASAKAWAGKGSVLNKMGNHDEALKAFDRALEISPDYSLALEWKGDALMDQGKYDDALKAYEKAIGTDMIFPKLWYKKGTALKALGHNSEADAAFAEAKERGYQASINVGGL